MLLLECYKNEVNNRGIEYVDNEETLKYIETASRWLISKKAKPGILLIGDPGNGKTTLGLAMRSLINVLYDSSISSERRVCAIYSALDLARIASDKENDGLFERIKQMPLLLLDDLGTESTTVKQWGNELIPIIDLLYYRYDKQLFTIATSNYDREKLGQKYGARIADRMNEMFNQIVFTNKSFRK